MKVIVTHGSPDMDAITSVWLIKRFLPGWEDAQVRFVPAGERLPASKGKESTIEKIGDDEVVHVDTGLGPLDHHQTQSDKICGASLTWDYVKVQSSEFRIKNDKTRSKEEALVRIVKVVVDVDHFKEVFWKDAMADYHEFSLVNILDGLKLQKPGDDAFYVEFIMQNLDALVHEFENRIWAEKEISESGKEFNIKSLSKVENLPAGRQGIGFDTLNDTVIKLSQKMGYILVVRKDPRKGYVRIKANPDSKIDLTLAYEQFKKIDPDATWFLHVSKRMLLNGSVKNPKMRPTTLSLEKIINVLEKV